MAEFTQEQGGQAQESAGSITVSCGSNSIPHGGVGLTVAELRSKTSKVLAIPQGSRALVNGVLVQDESTFIVQAGQHIEFVKEAGQKGQ